GARPPSRCPQRFQQVEIFEESEVLANGASLMKKVIGTITLILALVPLAHAQDTVGDKAREAKTDAVQAKRTAGKEIRKTGRAVKSTGRKVRQAVITRC